MRRPSGKLGVLLENPTVHNPCDTQQWHPPGQRAQAQGGGGCAIGRPGSATRPESRRQQERLADPTTDHGAAQGWYCMRCRSYHFGACAALAGDQQGYPGARGLGGGNVSEAGSAGSSLVCHRQGRHHRAHELDQAHPHRLASPGVCTPATREIDARAISASYHDTCGWQCVSGKPCEGSSWTVRGKPRRAGASCRTWAVRAPSCSA